MSDQRHVVVVGGGIVGLATARALQESGIRRVVVLEKEAEVGSHQSGRNSGVIHSGIYYRPGSLKAENCREGKARLVAFCEEHAVTYDMCGKVIVATEERERPGLMRILERGRANGIPCELIGPERLRELEPHAAGVAAIHVPDAGIVDFKGVCLRLRELIEADGGSVETGSEVIGFRTFSGRVIVETKAGQFEAEGVVNCGGLFSDRIARLAGFEPDVRIVPFRGEYYELLPERRSLCRNLIYPVPDPAFPFLGVHFTRMFDGRVECGPSAILALAREGYGWRDVSLGDAFEALTYPGLLRMLARHWRTGISEVRQSLSKSAYTRTLQRLVPEVTADDLVAAPSGVRAQALTKSGDLVDDFYVVRDGRFVHVLNAASPAATSSLNVGQYIARFVTE